MRRLLLIALAVCLAPTARADLIAWLPIDGDLEDATGNGNDGTYQGGEFPFFVDGFDGAADGAMQFDGVDDIVVLTPSVGLPISNAESFSVAMWVNGPVQSDKRVFSESSSTNNNPLFNLGTHNTGANGAFNNYLRPGPGHRQTSFVAYDETWHHVAWVQRGDLVDVYVDGVRDPVALHYVRQDRAVDTTTIGGILRATACCFFTGAIDDVRIYDHALTEDEVIELIPTEDCPEEGDTHCGSLELTARPFLNGPGEHTFTAAGSDDSGDEVLYTFWFDNGATLLQVGPQADPTAAITLTDGVWNVTVRVDDELGCFDRSEDDTCAIEVVVAAEPECISHWAYDGDLLDSGIGANDGAFFGDAGPNFVEGFDGTPMGAIQFDGVDDYVAFEQANGLPIYANRAYTVAMWVKGPPQADKRVFSEGSTASNTPLINIGTDNTGNTGSLDIFIRTGPTELNHLKSERPAFDDTWHHIAWVDDGGQGTIYIDGVADCVMPTYTRAAAIPTLDTTSSGGILRAAPCCWFAGAIDDLRVYNYALSAEEIVALIPEPEDCDGEADTVCDGLSVEGPEGGIEGEYTLTASGTDLGGDELLYYRFEITLEDGTVICQGPLQDNVLTTALPAGTHEARVTVDDRILCRDESEEATCSTTIVVRTEAPELISRWTFDADLFDSGPGANDGFWQGATDPIFVEGYDCEPEGAISFGGDGAGPDGVDDLIVVSTGDGLPVTQRSTFSIAMWVKGPPQNDKRVFSESNAGGDNNTLFNIGTDNTGATGSVDFFLRNASGAQIAAHVKSDGVAFDDTWHHITWTDDNGTVVLYIDGQPDAVDFSYPRQNLTVNTTTIGGILRGNSCCEFQGAIDDVQIYNYILSQDEVLAIYGDGPCSACPEEGDTHCDGLDVSVATDGGAGVGDTVAYVVTAFATDDSGDDIFYTFSAEPLDPAGAPIVKDPQLNNVTTFDLSPGTWRISVTVDDDPDCDDVADDATCSTDIEVVIETGVGPFLRGDCDGNGAVTGQVNDAIYLLNFNFSGGPRPGCLAACDANGDGSVIGGVTDAVYLLNFNFLGGPAPTTPYPECTTSSLPNDEAAGCDTPQTCP